MIQRVALHILHIVFYELVTTRTKKVSRETTHKGMTRSLKQTYVYVSAKRAIKTWTHSEPVSTMTEARDPSLPTVGRFVGEL